MPRRCLALLAILALPGCLATQPPASHAPAVPHRRVAAGHSGAVAAPEPLAARVGADVLRRGGNAVDAAVAVQFALSVTYPLASPIGGGGFALVWDPGAGRAFALDYREVAPAGATEGMFLGPDGEVVPGLSLYSHLSAGVPGTVRGTWELHRRFGSMKWRALLEPAIRLAEEGFPVDEWTVRSMSRQRKRLAVLPERLRRWIDFPEHFALGPGRWFRQPELGRTLRRIAERGPAGFYEGPTATAIVREMRRGGGLITGEDLRRYRAVWREPVSGSYRGVTVHSMPPPSSGGVALLQMLGLFERFQLPERLSTEHVHLVAEIAKRVFADRSRYIGDPGFYPVPVGALLDPDYLERRARSIRLDGRTDPGSVLPGEVAPEPVGGDTAHFSIVDATGMAVANTVTLNAAYGSGIVVDGAGFLLNDEMDDFSAKPGVPNLYGVTGGEANKIEPDKRMVSSMTPTIVTRNGRPWLVLGSPGGSTIFTTVFHVLTGRIDYGLSLPEAVEAPRFHHQWPPPPGDEDPVYTEKGRPLPEGTLGGLRRLGYTVRERDSLGSVQAVEISPGGGVTAVADTRRNGAAAVP
ncbi:MAG: gamma-glutamyltransferase [Acidobacteria bacterium]|nr:MAG: gamma-glutamyltransferase [Acidobacteriota bacterium]